MKKYLHDFDFILRGLALLTLAVGLVWTLQSLRDRPTEKARLQTRLDVLGELESLRLARDNDRLYLAQLEQMPRPVRAMPPARLLAEYMPGINPEIMEQARRSLENGWKVRRLEIKLNEVELDKLGTMLTAAAKQQPPWVLRSCDITASTMRDGAGRVVMQIETLERE